MKNELGLFERKGNVYVSTRIIAEKFEKLHKEIIYILEGMRSETSDGKIKINNNGLLNDLSQGGISHLEQYFVKSKYIGDTLYYKSCFIKRVSAQKRGEIYEQSYRYS